MTCLLKTTEVILVDWVLGRWAFGGPPWPEQRGETLFCGTTGAEDRVKL